MSVCAYIPTLHSGVRIRDKLVNMLYYLCLSEEDYDDVDSNTRHTEVDNEDDNDNKNDTQFDPYAFALKVLENEAAKINQRKHGLMVMLITKSMMMMLLRRRMSKVQH